MRPSERMNALIAEARASTFGYRHRAKVYRWESHCVNVHKQVWNHSNPKLPQELDKLIEEMLVKAAKAGLLPKHMKHPPMVPIKYPGLIMGGVGLDRPHADLFRQDIWLTDKTMQPATVLHELAHIMEHEKAHGRDWLHRYITLLGWQGLNTVRLIKDAKRYRILS